MNFIDLEALGRYVKDSQQTISSLNRDLATCRKELADQKEHIRQLQEALVRKTTITYPRADRLREGRRFHF